MEFDSRSQEVPVTDPIERFTRFSERFMDRLFRDAPESATAMGVHDYDDRLSDYSAPFARDQLERRKEDLRELRKIDPKALPDELRIDHALLDRSLETEIRTDEAHPYWERNPTYYVSSPLSAIFISTVREFSPLEDRLRSISERLRAVPDALKEARANLRNPPRIHARIALETALGGVGFYGQVLPGLASRVPSLEGEIRERGIRASDALRAYAGFLEENMEGFCGDFALGRELFDLKLRNEHFLDLDSEGLLGLGQKIFQETVKAIETKAREIDPGRTWTELVSELKAHHPTAETLKPTYAEWMARARDFVRERDILTFPENESLEVIDTPAFYRSVLPYAAYMPAAAFEHDQKGFFFVTPVDGLPKETQEEKLRGHCLHTIPVIALHEAYPGHHLQLSIGHGKGTKLRKLFMSNVFAEGWALYCEELMDELGFYGDPETKLFQLKDQLWRAARVILDVSLHTRRMSVEDAVRFLVEKVHLEESNAAAEVKRYTTDPTQPMSYIVGKKAILELRDTYREKKGSSFDLKEFHDRLLSFGTVPPNLVRDRILPRT
jgi:uncharacterized protein (DUF885 family)